ncbi:7285_t:CDS:1, partial [Rhizophagus irregularis]
MYTRACNIFKLSQPSILDFVKVSLDIAINIQNTNGNLWKIKIRRTADNDH